MRVDEERWITWYRLHTQILYGRS